MSAPFCISPTRGMTLQLMAERKQETAVPMQYHRGTERPVPLDRHVKISSDILASHICRQGCAVPVGTRAHADHSHLRALCRRLARAPLQQCGQGTIPWALHARRRAYQWPRCHVRPCLLPRYTFIGIRGLYRVTSCNVDVTRPDDLLTAACVSASATSADLHSGQTVNCCFLPWPALLCG